MIGAVAVGKGPWGGGVETGAALVSTPVQLLVRENIPPTIGSASLEFAALRAESARRQER